MKKLSVLILVLVSLGWFMKSAQANSFGAWFFSIQHYQGVEPVTDATYQEECGSCHYAYPPGLLPKRSWEKLLTNDALKDHFGESAELPEGKLVSIREYAFNHSADQSHYAISRKVMAAVTNTEAPLRITELRFIRRKHHEIPTAMVKLNTQVKSLSNCNACHTESKGGVFVEDTVKIPNYPDYR